MDPILDQTIKTIMSSGPVALLAIVTCWKLWTALQKEREDRAAESKAERDRHAAEERALQDRIIAVMSQLTGAMKDSHHD